MRHVFVPRCDVNDHDFGNGSQQDTEETRVKNAHDLFGWLLFVWRGFTNGQNIENS